MKANGYYIGLFIGSLILAPLLIHWYERSKVNLDGGKYVSEFMDASQDVRVHIDTCYKNGAFKDFHSVYNKPRDVAHLAKYKFLNKGDNKYYAITMFNPWGDWTIEMEDRKFDDVLIARINKFQLNNPDYGTAENPIPILKFDVLGNENDTLNTSAKQYLFNVHEYLIYVMPKKEFKKMFENK